MPGDLVLSLNSKVLHDVIDYQFYLEEGVNRLEIERAGSRLGADLDSRAGADPGLSFSSTIFDGIRTCRCGCIFCFVAQLPRGLRKSLYVRDDDFRLSFLYGNFITLGNLSQSDIDRILEQRLSPLYVSVHATDPEVRGRMMGTSTETAAGALAVLKRLGEGGIRSHIQLVLCPGINDGGVLEQTIPELAADFPGIASIGAVPVAVSGTYSGDTILNKESESRYSVLFPPNRPGPLRPFSEPECRDVISRIEAWKERFRRERGEGFVYAADEFYLRSGVPLPPLDDYDDFPQYQNGIGIAASFSAEAEEMIAPVALEHPRAARLFLLTGTLATGLMEQVCDRLRLSLKREIRPLAAANATFGPHVTVTALLGGRDILNAAVSAGLQGPDLLLIPVLATDGAARPRFIDDMTLPELKAQLPCAALILAP